MMKKEHHVGRVIDYFGDIPMKWQQVCDQNDPYYYPVLA